MNLRGGRLNNLKIAHKNTIGAANNPLSQTGKSWQDKIRKFTLTAQQIRPANRTGGMLVDPPLLQYISTAASPRSFNVLFSKNFTVFLLVILQTRNNANGEM
jgi:hypothetical protein